MVSDDGAIVLLEQVTVIMIPGYSLNPNLRPPPPPVQVNGAAPNWSVGDSPGDFENAARIINAGYGLASRYPPELPTNVAIRVVVQRAIWYSVDPQNFGVQRLREDISVQIRITGGAQTPQQAQALGDALWSAVDLTLTQSNAREPVAFAEETP